MEKDNKPRKLEGKKYKYYKEDQPSHHYYIQINYPGQEYQ